MLTDGITKSPHAGNRQPEHGLDKVLGTLADVIVLAVAIVASNTHALQWHRRRADTTVRLTLLRRRKLDGENTNG